MKRLIVALGLIIAVVFISLSLMGGGEYEHPEGGKGMTSTYVEVFDFRGHTYLVFRGMNQSYPPFVIEVMGE